MSLVTFLLELVLVAAGAYGLRQWHRWLFVLALAAGVIGFIISIAQYFVTGGIWWFAPWDFLLAPATIAVVFAAFGIGPLAAQLRSRSDSSDTDFDRELYANLVELADLLNNGPSRRDRASIESWIAQANTRGVRVLHNFERMNAPTRGWRDLLGAYIDLTRKTVAAIPSGVTPDERRQLATEGDELSRRYEALRRRYGKRRRT